MMRVFVLLLPTILAGIAYAQDGTAIKQVPTYCAKSELVLDALAQAGKPTDLIIAIARRGDGENRVAINTRRLYNVRVYLTEILTDPSVKRKRESLVLAQGERVPGLGRIEFYLNGRLFDVIFLKRNSDLFLGTCYPDPGTDDCGSVLDRKFFPCVDGKRHNPD